MGLFDRKYATLCPNCYSNQTHLGANRGEDTYGCYCDSCGQQFDGPALDEKPKPVPYNKRPYKYSQHFKDMCEESKDLCEDEVGRGCSPVGGLVSAIGLGVVTGAILGHEHPVKPHAHEAVEIIDSI